MASEHHHTIMSHQIWHFLYAIFSIILFWWLSVYYSLLPENTLWGITTRGWYWVAIITPLLHQIIIGLLWRAELLNKSLTKTFGSTDRGFLIYKIIFSLFFIARIVAPIILGYVTRGTVQNSTLVIIFYLLGVLLIVPVAYLGYSVKHYFGVNRAFGADHFYDEYKQKPFVKDGIFKYTNNAMYTYGLLGLWLPGLFFSSYIALITGIFSHLAVWAHYFFTEKPDMDYIYG